MKNTLISNFNHYRDYILFGFVFFVGVFTKIWNAAQKGKRITLAYIVAEALVSFFVAYSVYVLLGEFVKLSNFTVCVICAWCGANSTIIHREVEYLIVAFFSFLKNSLKINKNDE